MNRTLIAHLLLLFLLASATPGVAVAAEPTAPEGATTTVYYFHGERRCATCRSIERTAESVVREHFAEQMRSGDLVWKTVNFDSEENGHYVKELGLAGSGVVIARVTAAGDVSDHEVLQDVWRFARDEGRMRTYLLQEIEDYLGRHG